MNKKEIKKLALHHGFQLKPQPDGAMDLHTYVYRFAADLLAAAPTPPEQEDEPMGYISKFGVDLFREAADQSMVTTVCSKEYGNYNIPLYTRPTNDGLLNGKFKVGDRVEKCTGDYSLEGVVVAAFQTIDRKLRYVVEHRPLAPGMLHIYGPSNLKLVDPLKNK